MIVVALLAAQSVGPPAPDETTNPICYAYYLQMKDLKFGSSEYVMWRNKQLEFKCGAFYKSK